MAITRLGTALAAMASFQTAAQIHVFVDDDAAPGGDGLSWATAMNDLREAVQLAENLGEFRGEVRIAGGDYLGDLAEPLEIDRYGGVLSGIVLKGGFAGLADTSMSDTRNLSAFVTTLRGLGGGPIIEVNSAAVLTGPRVLGPGPFGALSGINLARATVFDGLRFEGDQAISVTAEPEAAVIVRDCTFESGSTDLSGGAIRGRLVALLVESSRFLDCHAEVNGGAISHFFGALVVRDSVFTGNSGRIGGAVQSESEAVLVTDTRFEGNRAMAFGGALHADAPQSRLISVECVDNQASSVGGAVYLGESAVAGTISASTFAQNAAGSGGAVHVQADDGVVTVLSSSFQMNTATVGGGISAPRGARVHMSNCLFRLNDASTRGGAIDAERLSVSSTTFELNSASSAGGALSLGTDSDVLLSSFKFNSAGDGGAVSGAGAVQRSTFQGNVARRKGGAVYQVGVISDVDFVGNSASDGGAVFDAEVIIDGRFEGNSAGALGGACRDVGTVERSVFEGNSAGLRGGAIYGMAFGDQLEVASNTAGFGGGGIRVADDFELSRSRVVGNTLTGDLNQAGDQIVIDGGAGLIDRCVIGSNLSNDAGTLAARSNADIVVLETLVGGQMRADSATIDARGCTIVGEPGSAVPAVLAEVAGLVLLESTAISADMPIKLIGNANAVVTQSYVSGGMSGIDADPFQFDVLGALVDGSPGFADPLGPDGDWSTWDDNDYSLRARSRLIDIGYGVGVGAGTARRDDLAGNSRDEGDAGVPGRYVGPRPVDIGAYEFQGTSCLPDMNDDGRISPADFSAWVIAYNTGDRFADQNQDGFITPADFNAWVSNYTTGCD